METTVVNRVDENVLAVVCYRGEWNYYAAELDVWVMDWEAWRREFVEAGYFVPQASAAERGGVLVLNEHSVERALDALRGNMVSEQSLRGALRARAPIVSWEQVMDLFPVVFLDFDRRRLFSVYAEALQLERYVPDGWVGVLGEFYDVVPVGHRYWIDGDRDYLQSALKR